MSLLVILLLVLALATGVLGVVVKGIAWLVFIAIALLVGGLVLGWRQRRGGSSTASTL
jgi:hypothetical protein